MSQTLEDRIIEVVVDGKKLTGEIRQFYPSDRMIVWVPEIQTALQLDYDKSANTSNAWHNEERGASCVYSRQSWSSTDKFTKIKVDKRTQTS